MPINAEAIPESLRRLDRWLGWRWVFNEKARGGEGAWTKPPFNARTGRLASSTEPGTWTDFDTALRAHLRGDFDGLAVALGDVPEVGQTLAGVDLDDVRDPGTGAIAPWAAWVIRRLNTYGDVSPSGTGGKLICWGTLPAGRRADHARGLEMYDGGRCWVITGHLLDGARPEIMPRGEALARLHAELLGDPPPARAANRDDRELALAALAALAPWRAGGYSDWLAVGMALHAVDPSELMLAAWDNWSRLAPDRYEDGACARKWKSFGRGGLTLGSLIYWARQDGWEPSPAGPGRGTTPAAPAPTPEQNLLALMDHLRQAPHHARALARILRDSEGGPSGCNQR